MRFANYLFQFFIVIYVAGLILVGLDLVPSWLNWSYSTFLILAGVLGIIYFIQIFKWQVGIPLSIAIFTVSFLCVSGGVNNQWWFGDLGYTELLLPAVNGVPIAIGFMWIMVIATGHAITSFLKTRNLPVRSVVASFLAVLLSVILEPVAYSALTFSVWFDDGIYFGIPWTSFFSWWFIAFVIHLVIYFFLPRPKDDYIWKNRLAIVYVLVMFMLLIIGVVHGLYTAVVIAALGTAILIYLLRKKLSYI